MSKYFYFNQNNYDNVIYDRPNTKKIETIKTSGCGVCSACNALNNLFKKEEYQVKEVANISVKCGARTSYGTDMNYLLNRLSKDGSFSFKYVGKSGLGDKLISHIKNGGVAILSTNGGNYSPDALFSNGGHLYSAVGYSGDNIYILDSGYYTGKLNLYGRYKYAKLQENYLIINKKYVEQASHNGGWLITLNKKTVEPTKKYSYCNTIAGLNFRKLPNATSNLVDGANSGKSVIGYRDKLQVLKSYDGWSNVIYREHTGYVSSKYLTSKNPAIKTVKVPKGYNLRSSVGISTKNKAFTTKSDIKVDLLVNGYWKKNFKYWSRIKYNDKTYYVALKF